MMGFFLLVFVIALVFFCLKINAGYTASLAMNVLDGTQRPLGPGLQVISPLEKITKSGISLKDQVHTWEEDFETDDESTIRVRVTIIEAAIFELLSAHQSFDGDSRINGIKEKVNKFLNNLIRKMEDRNAVMDSLEELGIRAKTRFEKAQTEDGVSLQQYFGTNLRSVALSGTELPEELRKAQTEKEAVEKRNETRQLGIKKLKELARMLVKEARDEEMDLTFKEALDAVQIEEGKTKKEIKIFGIEAGSQLVFEKALKAVFEKGGVSHGG